MKRVIAIVLLVATLFMGSGALYYFVGNHNCVGSRSFWLEKEIRNLLFHETHEPIDYREASRKYRVLLGKIRFDNSKDDYTTRYTKALKRAEIKARAQILLDQYESDSDPTALRAAWALFDNDGYKKLEEYGFLSFYWKGEMIHQEQFERMLREAQQPADGKSQEAPQSPR